MHTLLICLSAFAESTNYLYGLWIYMALLVICENLNNTLIKPTDVGMSNLFLIVKSKLNSLLKCVSIKHFCQLKMKHS